MAQITKNLISVSKFTKDNNVIADFFSNGCLICLIKDKTTKQVLLKGTLKIGLYQLDTSQIKRSPGKVINQAHLADIEDGLEVGQVTFSYQSIHFTCNKVDSISCNKEHSSVSSSSLPYSGVSSSSLPYSCFFTSAKQIEYMSDNDEIALIWQNRLGHPLARVFDKILHLVDDYVTSRKVDFCNACPLGKAHRLFSGLSNFRAKNPLEIVHSDVWGPAPLLSNEGYKYYVHFIDDYSRYTWVYPLQTKSEFKIAFIQFHSMAERLFNKKLVCLQSDWGREYKSLTPLLQQLGIQFRHSCPYAHHQNGRAKRKYRHIVELGLTLLAQASMPLSFWWNAFASTIFIINKLPTQVLSHKSPYEMVYGRLPNFSFLKVFGCACFPFLRPYNQNKLQFRSAKCIFLSYSSKHKGYLCLHSSGKIYVACDVLFNEVESPFSNGFPSKPSNSVSTAPTNTNQAIHLPIVFPIGSQGRYSISSSAPTPIISEPLGACSSPTGPPFSSDSTHVGLQNDSLHSGSTSQNYSAAFFNNSRNLVSVPILVNALRESGTQSLSSHQLVQSNATSSITPLLTQLHRPYPDSTHAMTTRSKIGISNQSASMFHYLVLHLV